MNTQVYREHFEFVENISHLNYNRIIEDLGRSGAGVVTSKGSSESMKSHCITGWLKDYHVTVCLRLQDS